MNSTGSGDIPSDRGSRSPKIPSINTSHAREVFFYINPVL